MPSQGLLAATAALALLLAGCASGPGGRTGSDGPEARPPSGLDRVPSAEPREEPIRQSGGTSRPYTVLGRSYTPITDDRPFRERGLASWYGRKFHGQATASGEPYDMYAMTAAHKTLPLPSYVRVRNPANGREVILRVNDRGPFHDDRIIDLSYTAALQLDLLRGVAPVEIERLTNADIRTGAWRQRGGEPATQLAAAPAPPAVPAPAGPSAAPAAAHAVPVAWVTPTASGAAERRAAGGAAAPAPAPAPLLLAQAAIPADAPAGTPGVLSDTAPPPRFGSMQTHELPPLAPVPSATPVPAPDGPPPTPPSGAAGAAAAGVGTAPSAAATRGIWLQLGAFRELSGAQVLQARAARSLPAVASQLRVFSEGDTHRLQAGPYASREVAQDVGLQLRNGLGLAPIVVERR
ncbi:septal ring lytic transglycosylase RlpA family protein [Xenophilus sp. Marseille-Q4582]|uniref:septal ring lytic transglycosylase RlpA family protein n=1 Tax=Xenophilus sp. Marseille-Q4582 TaxID=2866600 RepID=UPI001CE460FA|nr:septal ring lytic transglycosylase RlpA family protein [Xenophilus sp. Marseille-Q4582]